jgi:fructose-1,6-bisphosphatase/inositol monophosphatase family enzyme
MPVVQSEDFSLPFDNTQAVQIIREAAAMSLSMRSSAVAVIKADQTLVTQADRQLEEFLRQRLSALAPEFSFLGEEGGLTGDPDAPCWIIDPIDGTTNFVRGVPLWCISVGAVWQGQAVWGCIAVPPQDEILWGAPGQGAWIGHLSRPDEEPLRLQTFDSDTLMQEDLIACNTMAEAAVDFTRVPCRLRNFGSLAYHLVALSRGALCCALSRQHKLYDIAAGIAICHEAGCVSRYLNGEPWVAEVVAPKEPMPLLVAPPQIMEILLQRLRLD